MHTETLVLQANAVVARSYSNLRAYRRSQALASDISWLSRRLQSQDQQSVIQQIFTVAHAVPDGIARAWTKRHDAEMLCTLLTEAANKAGELAHWLNVARACGHLTADEHQVLMDRQQIVERTIRRLQHQPHMIVV
jgi:four helix bundle protein